MAVRERTEPRKDRAEDKDLSCTATNLRGFEWLFQSKLPRWLRPLLFFIPISKYAIMYENFRFGWRNF